MNRSDRNRVLRGEVLLGGRWTSIDKKIEAEQQRRRKIEKGYVFHRGEWITIDEKIARVAPSVLKEEKETSTIVINNYDNRTVYNIDKRTTHHHEHRHLHIDQDEFERKLQEKLPKSKRIPYSVDGKRGVDEKLSSSEESEAIEGGRGINGLLEAQEDNK